MVNKFVAFVETVVKIPGEGVRRRAKFPGEGSKEGKFSGRGGHIYLRPPGEGDLPGEGGI